ncbi:hypothetical protein RIF29_25271 [Crotalaria pallida]|uniref:Uncharacterized protein n=1 Tax=Crotalaria pallida TaxID=3830 RepID=A0AAN9HZM7_CROPI
MASKLLLNRRLFRFLRLSPLSSPPLHYSPICQAGILSVKASEASVLSNSSRSFCTRSSNLVDESQVPTAIDYSSVLQEGEFHRLADSTIHSLQEKLERFDKLLG